LIDASINTIVRWIGSDGSGLIALRVLDSAADRIAQLVGDFMNSERR
jgi:hypothetical protein